MRNGVRYQIYESKDGHVLFQASERAFWQNFCQAVGRDDLFERFPGARVADHAPGNRELQAELRGIFKGRTSAEWIAFGEEHNIPIAPMNTPRTLADDPQFADRLPWLPGDRLGADQLPFPVKLVGEELPIPTRAPGGSGLSVSSGGQFTYRWKTVDDWAGTCREVVVTRDDGRQHRAFFRFS
jgi:crotonobetainyl-CoA:carnitine CoA-transferase CaiB-like acyl-CoA transferase